MSEFDKLLEEEWNERNELERSGARNIVAMAFLATCAAIAALLALYHLFMTGDGLQGTLMVIIALLFGVFAVRAYKKYLRAFHRVTEITKNREGDQLDYPKPKDSPESNQ